MEKHTTVLLTEAVDALAITSDAIIVDATLGSGGHAEQIVSRLGSNGVFVGMDADPDAILHAEHLRTHAQATVHLSVANFANIDSILDTLGITEVDGILADLGWRMEQFSGNGKGFSFQIDEPLIMTFGDQRHYPFTAYDIVNTWDLKHITTILRGYSDERYAHSIARAIGEARTKTPIRTTHELVEVILSAVPPHYRRGKIHPATRTFQALRIAVNDELTVLETFIEKSVVRLKHGGRLAIISFHSLEDRIVKHLFRAFGGENGNVITKKPITASELELRTNPRSRSAKLRIFEKT